MKNQLSIKQAAVINIIGRYSKVAITLVVSAVLSRILSAEDYGVVAVVTVFTTFFALFADMGFGPAVIQNKELTAEDIDNIYSLTVYIAVFLMLTFAAAAYLIAAFYEDALYISVGQLLSISLLFNALNMVPNGLLNREKKFVSLAIRTIVVYVASAIVAIALALYGLRYYALVAQTILTAFFTFIWNFATTRPHFRFKINFGSIKKVLNYSGFQFASNVINYFSRNLDSLLTGKIMGSAELGYYNKAYQLMLYPVNNLSGVVTPVLHPIFSDYQHQRDVMFQKFMKILRLLLCIGVYVAPACFLAAEEMVGIMYGDAWGNSVMCFRYLSGAIIPQMLNPCVGSTFQALGQTKMLFISGVLGTAATVVAILVGVLWGGNIVALSICIAIAYVLQMIIAFYLLIARLYRMKIGEFLKELLPEMMILAAVVVGVALYPFSMENIFLSLVIKCAWLGVIYLAMLFVTKEYKLLKSLIHK